MHIGQVCNSCSANELARQELAQHNTVRIVDTSRGSTSGDCCRFCKSESVDVEPRVAFGLGPSPFPRRPESQDRSYTQASGYYEIAFCITRQRQCRPLGRASFAWDSVRRPFVAW